MSSRCQSHLMTSYSVGLFAADQLKKQMLGIFWGVVWVGLIIPFSLLFLFSFSLLFQFCFPPELADLPGSMSGRESVAVSFDAVQSKYAVLFLKTLSIRLSEARMSLLIFGSRCNFFFFGRGEILHILALSDVHVHPDQSHIWGVVCPFCARNKVLLMLNKGRTWTSCRYADKHLLSWKCANVCGGSSSTGWWNYCHRFRKPAAARQHQASTRCTSLIPSPRLDLAVIRR